MGDLRERVWRLGLTGWPLTTSRSPQLHAAALASADLKGDYRLFPTPLPPEGNQRLRDLCEQLRRTELHGLNVTIPHKQNLIPLTDRLTPVARDIGAVNTLSMKDGELVGDNTDAPGFLADLAGIFGEEFETPASNRLAVVLGAGGSARAIVYALARQGWRIHIAARREEQARGLAEEMGALSGAGQITYSCLDKIGLRRVVRETRLVVNATPVGMAPYVSTNPWPQGLALPLQADVYDLVYTPMETALVCQARAMGLRAANGMGMLVEQAALSFEIWTGLPADRVAMRSAVDLVPIQRAQGGA